MLISRRAAEEMVVHAREERPRECCGVLLGRDGDVIVEAVRTRNLADLPTRFLVDPQGHIDALRDGRRRGLDVVGFYHSHPESAAVPSPRDLEEASYPDCLYLIVGLAGESAEIRAFHFDGSRFTEVAFDLE